MTADAEPDQWKVLVPLRILEGDSLSGGMIDFLAPVPVVVLGLHVVPDQTAPGQARMQFEDRAESALDAVATEIAEAGGTVETRLVFTNDREESVDRVASETGCEVILRRNPVAHVDSVLVAVRGGVNADRIADFAGTVLAGREIGVTLFRAVESEGAVGDAKDLLSGLADRLARVGVDPGAIEETVEVADDALPSVVAAAADHDAVVVGESQPTLRSFVFGEFSGRVADRTVAPVLVVTGPGPGAGESEGEESEPPESEEDGSGP